MQSGKAQNLMQLFPRGRNQSQRRQADGPAEPAHRSCAFVAEGPEMAKSTFRSIFFFSLVVSVVIGCLSAPGFAQRGGGGHGGGGGFHGGGGGGFHGGSSGGSFRGGGSSGGGAYRGSASSPRMGSGSYGSPRGNGSPYRNPGYGGPRSSGSAAPNRMSQGRPYSSGAYSSGPRTSPSADGQWHSFAGPRGTGGPAAACSAMARAS